MPERRAGFHLGPIYWGVEGKSEWSNGRGCKKISSFFLHNFLYIVICTWCHCYRLYCRLYCILYLECWINLHYVAHARRQGSACGAPLPVWELDPLQFEGGRLETEVQWRGALSISKGGGQKSKGGAAPRYVALDETLPFENVIFGFFGFG